MFSGTFTRFSRLAIGHEYGMIVVPGGGGGEWGAIRGCAAGQGMPFVLSVLNSVYNSHESTS